MEATRVPTDHIDATGPRPVVRGTDIKVSQVASEYEHMGMSPDEIIQAHPHLSLGDVHAALAYYYDHQERIRQEWRDANALVSAMRNRYPDRRSSRHDT